MPVRMKQQRQIPLIIVGRWKPDFDVSLHEQWGNTPTSRVVLKARPCQESPGIRSPEENVDHVHDKSASAWHRDCHGEAQTCFIWSTVKTTEFRWRYSRKIWQPEPFDIVAWDNRVDTFLHRRPLDITLDDNRWSLVWRTPIPFDQVLQLFPEARKGGF